MEISTVQNGNHSGDKIAVDEEADLGRIVEDRKVGYVREMVGTSRGSRANTRRGHSPDRNAGTCIGQDRCYK
jgi:hypothetical protein